MAFTTTQLAALESAIASGELSVEYDGKKVTYRSMADLERAYALVQSKLVESGAIARSTEIRTSKAAFSKD